MPVASITSLLRARSHQVAFKSPLQLSSPPRRFSFCSLYCARSFLLCVHSAEKQTVRRRLARGVVTRLSRREANRSRHVRTHRSYLSPLSHRPWWSPGPWASLRDTRIVLRPEFQPFVSRSHVELPSPSAFQGPACCGGRCAAVNACYDHVFAVRAGNVGIFYAAAFVSPDDTFSSAVVSSSGSEGSDCPEQNWSYRGRNGSDCLKQSGSHR